MYDDDDDPLQGMQPRMRQRVRRRDRAHAKQKRRKETLESASGTAPTVGAVVVGVGPGSATVVTAIGEELACALDPRLRQVQRGAMCVGDDVVVARDPSGVDLVIRVCPRRTYLARRDTQNRHREQLLVANVDTVVVTAAATDPPFRPRLVDRYLVAIRRGGADAVLAINKMDDADEERREELERLVEPYRAIGLAVHLVSASTGEGLAALCETLAGCRCAFVGHSGVGKSSLVTAMGSAAVAGGLAEHGRGRHTTSTATLHQLPGGTQVIDTPGVRQFGLHQLSRRELRDGFVEFAPFAVHCGFADCTHSHEEGCAVRDAVERGEIAGARYDSYQRLLAQAGG